MQPVAKEEFGPQDLVRILFKVGWLSIVLGIVLELVLIGLQLSLGRNLGLSEAIGGTLSKISWSVVACMGLAFAGAASKGNLALTGLGGLLAAPLALFVARVVHKVAKDAMGVADLGAGSDVFLTAGLKALQYGLFGMVLVVLGNRAIQTFSSYIGAGVGFGVFFTPLALWVSNQTATAPPSTATLITSGVNELLFPVGCALTVYASKALNFPKK
jgi:hypothetical protein